jgi:hypothetical protein
MKFSHMLWMIPCSFLLIAGAAAAAQIWAHMRMLDARKQTEAPVVDADRYRPMLRLLSGDDSGLVTNPALRRKLRAQRCGLFRQYLRCLAQDYGKLLAGLRLIMTQSGSDRPDLAKALAKNRVLFAVAVWRIEFHLRLYALGLGRADVLKREVKILVDSLDILRGQFSLVESAVWGA